MGPFFPDGKDDRFLTLMDWLVTNIMLGVAVVMVWLFIYLLQTHLNVS